MCKLATISCKADGACRDCRASLALSPGAAALLMAASEPSSQVHRPGDFSVSASTAQFGQDAIGEVLSAGMISLGGMPADLPVFIVQKYPKAVAAHLSLVARTARYGQSMYPAAESVGLITEAGWRAVCRLHREAELTQKESLSEDGTIRRTRQAA